MKIENWSIFESCVREVLVRIERKDLTAQRKRRACRAVRKAVIRMRSDKALLHYDADADRFVIASETSTKIYEISPGRRCGCIAGQNGVICWHKAAKRLIELYNAAMLAALCSEYVAERSLKTGRAKTAIVRDLRPASGNLVRFPVKEAKEITNREAVISFVNPQNCEVKEIS